MADAAAAGEPRFRKPALKDVVFAVKAFAAAVIALGLGFSQGFENPYWSALTVYVVVNPPGAGAVRSKAIFRFIGTLVGGGLILLAAGAFSDHMAFLLAALVSVVVGATFLHRSDRTPTNYIWFAVAITAVAVGITRMTQPSSLFDLVTARVGEIVFGILVIAAIDGIFWPRVMLPEFLDAMAQWRGKVRDRLLDALADRGDGTTEDARHAGARELAAQVIAIDAKGVQLPFDPVPLAPRSRHVRLLRSKVVHLVADLGGIAQWADASHAGGQSRASLEPQLDAAVAWLRAAPPATGAAVDAHVADGERLARDLDAACAAQDPAASRAALLQHGLLVRVAAFVRDWCDLALVLRAIETGGRMPDRLDAQSRRVRVVRSVDYAASALDVAPMVLSMAVAALIWYWTNWNAGAPGLIFAFVACLMLLGKKPEVKTLAGIVVALLVVFALVLVYEFAVLPRVADFPVLVVVLGCILLPFGVLMSIHPIGMLLAMLFFAMLGLQNAYRYDFEQTLNTVSGALTGMVLGFLCIRLLDHDRERFACRRLADAARLDVIDTARSARPVSRERFLSLAVDRVSLFSGNLEALEGRNEAPPAARPMDDLSVGSNVLALRRLEADLSPHAQAVVRTVRSEVAHEFRRRRREGGAHASALDHVIASAIDDTAVRRDRRCAELLDALVGIQLGLGAANAGAATP